MRVFTVQQCGGGARMREGGEGGCSSAVQQCGAAVRWGSKDARGMGVSSGYFGALRS